MCLSEPVSFAAGGLLIAGGAFAGWKALNVNKRYLPIALMPVMAGVRQLMEGHVWMGLGQADAFMVWWGAMGFIFFSWLIWPTWIPFAVYVLEPPRSNRKAPLLYLALAGVVLGVLLYVPHVRSEEHTSELQSLMRFSYAVFCLKKNKYICRIQPHIKDDSISHTQTTSTAH